MYTAHDAVNALQLERLWAFAAHDHLDRERVTMTTICQAVEFCLKALQTHTGYRSTGVFAFADGHNLKVLYESLPCDLRQELHCESVGFADKFSRLRESHRRCGVAVSSRPFCPTRSGCLEKTEGPHRTNLATRHSSTSTIRRQWKHSDARQRTGLKRRSTALKGSLTTGTRRFRARTSIRPRAFIGA